METASTVRSPARSNRQVLERFNGCHKIYQRGSRVNPVFKPIPPKWGIQLNGRDKPIPVYEFHFHSVFGFGYPVACCGEEKPLLSGCLTQLIEICSLP